MRNQILKNDNEHYMQPIPIQPRSIKKNRGFCWQEAMIISLIIEKYSGKKLTTALAVYAILTHIANRAKETEKKEFKAYYAQISRKCGKSISTVKLYCREFIKLGILAKQNIKQGKQNLANIWTLTAWSSRMHANSPSVKDNKQRG